MSLRIGIVGLPNVGKSTLFNALLKKQVAESANYPFCTIDPNTGTVSVPDPRLDSLAIIEQSQKTIPATIEFVDIAGLVKGASKGEGLGNQFLAHIRETHAILHLLRGFEDENIIRAQGSGSTPAEDREIIEMELILADLDGMERRMEKNKSALKSGQKDAKELAALLEKTVAVLAAGKMASTVPLTPAEEPLFKQFQLLSAKPVLYGLNLSEAEIGQVDVEAHKKRLGLGKGDRLVPLCAKIESDLVDFSEDERKEMLASLGLSEPPINGLIREAYALLGLITYFTVGPKEARAWPIPLGFTAPKAAGEIHTDFERGFIRAEVISCEDYIALKGKNGAKESGKLRLCGKDYVMADGDVCNFLFNV
ncbi:MAG: redox-regulated ATPase YchF [Deltaproteobacteria bacterium]|nr:redox-regulated ATPase YchF [Deltaproteobacteria bacterium]